MTIILGAIDLIFRKTNRKLYPLGLRKVTGCFSTYFDPKYINEKDGKLCEKNLEPHLLKTEIIFIFVRLKRGLSV